MARRYSFEQTHDIRAWCDLGAAALADDFRRLATKEARQSGAPLPPPTLDVESTFCRWVDDPEQSLTACDEPDADVVTLTAYWEA